MCRKAPWSSKREKCQPTHKPVLWNPSWLRDARAHLGGSWDIPNTDSEQGKARWLAKGSLEELPHKSDLSYHEGATLSLSPPVCLSTRNLFPPNKHFASLLSVFVGIHFCKAKGPGPCQWSLVTGLLARIQLSHCHGLMSSSGREPKSCFKPLLAEALRDQGQRQKFVEGIGIFQEMDI